MKRVGFWLVVGGGLFFLLLQQTPRTQPVAQEPHGAATAPVVVPAPAASTPSVPQSAPPAPTTTFMIGGDLMFDRMVNHTYKAVGTEHVFDGFDTGLFRGKDVALANLEGPISPVPIDDNITANNLTFNFPPDSIAALRSLGLTAVSLANNHSLNAGRSGLAATKRLLSDAGIVPIGQEDAFNGDSVHRFAGSIPVSVVAVNLLAKPNQAAVEAAVRREHEAGQFVIVFPHWGVEYRATHTPSQAVAAHGWIEAGADAVIGAHPHVIEDLELYHGKPIVYSLGNFVFDQTFSEATQHGLLVGGTITSGSLQLTFVPISLKGLHPSVLGGAQRTSILSDLFSSQGDGDRAQLTDDTLTLSR